MFTHIAKFKPQTVLQRTLSEMLRVNSYLIVRILLIMIITKDGAAEICVDRKDMTWWDVMYQNQRVSGSCGE